jgi:UDP-3-O-[3-hydroxymyristoyl] glucosamine N-acyltransferase
MGKKAKAPKTHVGPDARVSGDAVLSGQARVIDHGRVSGRSVVGEQACVRDEARVAGQAEVRERAVVSGHAWVYENALVKGRAHITDDACVFGDAVVSGETTIGGAANVGPRARVKQSDHVVTYASDEISVKRVDPRTHNGPDVWTAYRTRHDGVRVMLGRRRKKVSEAPRELLTLITWTKV